MRLWDPPRSGCRRRLDENLETPLVDGDDDAPREQDDGKVSWLQVFVSLIFSNAMSNLATVFLSAFEPSQGECPTVKPFLWNLRDSDVFILSYFTYGCLLLHVWTTWVWVSSSFRGGHDLAGRCLTLGIVLCMGGMAHSVHGGMRNLRGLELMMDSAMGAVGFLFLTVARIVFHCRGPARRAWFIVLAALSVEFIALISAQLIFDADTGKNSCISVILMLISVFMIPLFQVVVCRSYLIIHKLTPIDAGHFAGSFANLVVIAVSFLFLCCAHDPNFFFRF